MTYSNIDLGSLINRKEIISFDKTRISYLFNERKNKGYLVFIHGLTGSYNSWRFVVPYFLKKGYGIIAPDLRGHFTSERDPKDYSYEACAKDINEILKKEKIGKVVFVTHCYGSFVALEFYRLCEKKAKAFVFCSADYSYVLKNIFFLNLDFFRKQVLFLLNALKGLYKRQVKYNPLKTQRVLRKYYEFTNHWTTVVKMFPYAANYNPKGILSKIKVPCLIIVGKYDWLTPKKNSLKMHKYFKNSKLCIISMAEHFIITLKNKKVNTTIEKFLENKI